MTTRNTAAITAITASALNDLGVREAGAENHNTPARTKRAEADHHIPGPATASRTKDKSSDGNMMAEPEASNKNTANIAKTIGM